MLQQNTPSNTNGWKAKWTSTEDILVVWYDFWWKKRVDSLSDSHHVWPGTCSFSSYISIIFTFPRKKNGNACNNKKKRRQQLIRKFNEFHFYRSCFVFWLPTVQWKALLERSELVGGWGLRVWIFRTCCLLTLKHWMTCNFLRPTFGNKMIMYTVSVYYSSILEVPIFTDMPVRDDTVFEHLNPHLVRMIRRQMPGLVTSIVNHGLMKTWSSWNVQSTKRHVSFKIRVITKCHDLF